MDHKKKKNLKINPEIVPANPIVTGDMNLNPNPLACIIKSQKWSDQAGALNEETKVLKLNPAGLHYDNIPNFP